MHGQEETPPVFVCTAVAKQGSICWFNRKVQSSAKEVFNAEAEGRPDMFPVAAVR